MPVIKIMTIIALIALMAIAMGEEMSEVPSSTTSFAMEEESTRMARMILNNKDKDSKSSTKFFMKENNKDEGVSCLDGLYNVTRKEENVLGNNKEKSEIKVKVKGGSLVWEISGQERRFSFLISLLYTSHGKWWK